MKQSIDDKLNDLLKRLPWEPNGTWSPPVRSLRKYIKLLRIERDAAIERMEPILTVLSEWLDHMHNCDKCGHCGATDRLVKMSGEALEAFHKKVAADCTCRICGQRFILGVNQECVCPFCYDGVTSDMEINPPIDLVKVKY